MDWIALDSAAALAILCHTLEELWDEEWRDSLSDNDNIIAYAWGKKERLGKWHLKTITFHSKDIFGECYKEKGSWEEASLRGVLGRVRDIFLCYNDMELLLAFIASGPQ